MEYRYKVVPFIGQSKGSLSATAVAEQLEVAISQHVAQGWEFYQLSDVNIEVQPGCISGLFGAKVHYVRFDQLIFRSALSVAIQPRPRTDGEQHKAIGPGPVGENDAEARQQGVGDEQRKRPALTITAAHLDLWQRKSDEELRAAAGALHEYTEEGRQVILAELARRSAVVVHGESDDEIASSLSYCYHCGSDVAVGSGTCGACGKTV